MLKNIRKTMLMLVMILTMSLSTLFSATFVYAADYSHNVKKLNETSSQILFESNVNTSWVDLHVKINSGAQLNFRMDIFETALKFVPQRSRFHKIVADCFDIVSKASDWLDGYEQINKKYGEYGHCQLYQECGLLINSDETGHITNAEGDVDHIVNEGALDPKSVSVTQLSTSPNRLKKVLYRAPNGTEWEEKDWEWAVTQIADRVKATRDATFTKKDDNGVTVNRTEGIAFLGGAANNSEDCYLAIKLTRALGLVKIEHQARI